MARKSYRTTRTSYGVLVEGKEFYQGQMVDFKAKCNEQLLEFERMRSDNSWTRREWVHLNNGHWRCKKYMQDNGYVREHIYDFVTGRVISEIDSAGRKDLADVRVREILSIRELTITPIDYFVSLELADPAATPKPKTDPLF